MIKNMKYNDLLWEVVDPGKNINYDCLGQDWDQRYHNEYSLILWENNHFNVIKRLPLKKQFYSNCFCVVLRRD